MRRKIRKPLVILVAVVIALACGNLVQPMTRHGHHDGAMADCVSNINQISKAMVMYASDYDGHFPQKWFDGDGSGGYTPHAGKVVDGVSDYAWAYALFEVTKSFQIFTCKQFPFDQNWDGRIAPTADEHGISYGMNSRLGEVGWQLPQVSYPAQTVLAFDLTAYLKEPWAGLPDGGNSPYQSSLGNAAFRVRVNHRRRGRWFASGEYFTIVGYCDGHAKAIRKAGLLATGEGPERNFWAPRR